MAKETSPSPSLPTVEGANAELLPGGITQKLLDAWKAKHGEVFAVSVAKSRDGDDMFTAYLHKPDRNIVGMAMQAYSKQDIVKAGEALILNCWLGGDDQIRTDDSCFVSAAVQAAELIELRSAEIKKL
jgi:hypothetical protein